MKFDNSFVRALPADPNPDNNTREVAGAGFSRVTPTPVSAPQLIASSSEMMTELGLQTIDADVFSGNRLLPGMDPYAACYGGHQFGNWAGQLGDGRAISLGEVVTSRRWELQLKGAGPTPYSRRADGRAVLRSSLREFLCSEAMFHLGVPTTRALSLVATGEQVVRDMFYDGHPRPEPGAVVCRVAPSFLRFGNFELAAARDDVALLKRLVDYTLETHFPSLDGPEALFLEVCRRTALMVLHWQRVGFVHGVMNTDNMSMLGLTIDYGPYGFLDDYDPAWTPNTTDAENRRYRYAEQPRVAHWNLLQLANALHPVIGSAQPLQMALDLYARTFDAGQRLMYADKLGLDVAPPALITDLLNLLTSAETDMTLFYRGLADVPHTGDDDALLQPLLAAYYGDFDRARTLSWLRQYLALAAPDRRERMNRVNPRFVPRNYLAQLAIEKAEQGDTSVLQRLHQVLRRPYDEQPEAAEFSGKRPDWARVKAGCSMLSCSS